MDLVTRVEDQSDRRINRIFLTANGKKRREKIYPFVLNLYQEASNQLRLEDIEQAMGTVRKMISNLE